MDKVLKPIPFYDRNNNRKHELKIKFVHPEHRVLSFTEVKNEKTGTICKKSSYKTVDRVSEMANYKVSDFSIENLLAVGAKLTPTHLVGDTDLKMLHLENSVSKIVNNESNNN